jgi:hypothetical protein
MERPAEPGQPRGREVRIGAKNRPLNKAREEARPRALITVVERAYYQPAAEGMPSASHTTAYEARLTGSEQVYGPRFFECGGEWQALDLGWVEKASMLFLDNKGESTVEISFHSEDGAPVPCLLVLPGDGVRLCPVDASLIRIRSLPPTRCAVTVFPG